MKYWIDTEFIARPFTIDLISIGVVADGREFYAEEQRDGLVEGEPVDAPKCAPPSSTARG